MAIACGTEDPVVPPLTDPWRKWSGNPLLLPGSPGTWDADGVGTPCVRRLDSGTYVMWFTGTGASGKSIGIAWSDDGIDWRKDVRNPVFTAGADGSWDADAVGDPCVLPTSSGYIMLYAGSSASGRAIGRATSADGIAWERAAENPVLPPAPAGTAWDDGETYTPWVLPATNGFEMWYGARGTGDGDGVGRALSPDGIHWTRFPSPVLDPQVLEAVCFAPCVLHEGSTYRMWCAAVHEAPGGTAFPAVIDYAQSSDGSEWTRNRLALSYGEPAAWDGGALRAACVRDEGAVMKMWYEGRSEAGGRAIGLALKP